MARGLRLVAPDFSTALNRHGLAILAVAFETLTRVRLAYSNELKLAPVLIILKMKTYADFEHVHAFTLLGTLVSVAHPPRPLVLCVVAAGCGSRVSGPDGGPPDTFIDVIIIKDPNSNPIFAQGRMGRRREVPCVREGQNQVRRRRQSAAQDRPAGNSCRAGSGSSRCEAEWRNGRAS